MKRLMMTGAIVSNCVTRLLLTFDNELHQTDLMKELGKKSAHLTNVIESINGSQLKRKKSAFIAQTSQVVLRC